MNDGVSREEFAMLRDAVQTTAVRLDAIDRGTGGIGALAVQVAEVVKDLAALKLDLDSFRRDHAWQHDQETRNRVSTRRWLIGTVIAALACIEVPLFYVIAHLHG
ncbi:MAG TPA: hypothetical protein VGV89_07240 [Thermoplasmata archaeon]|nr:hypothetical protein [Thermoplasmata archaeon]